MSNSDVYTRSEQIQDVSAERPHLVILGAGASLAALPNGDATGRRLPLMINLVETLGLEKLLTAAGIDYKGQNFEDVYSRLAADPQFANLQHEVEKSVADYFSTMRLPSEPTIYDYLVLSLRPKDGIATFNWDPFLLQALERNHGCAAMPTFFHLHGCAAVGWCESDKRQGLLGGRCPKCNQPFKPIKLLYPVANKDYTNDPYISSQWQSLQAGLNGAFLLTMFGYGAPKSDAAAVALMKSAWGTPEKRWLEEIEIIDVKPEEELRTTWGGFIHSHHYSVTSDYFKSILAMHPRRSVEAYWQSLVEARFREENWVPRTNSLQELHDWFQPLIAAERKP